MLRNFIFHRAVFKKKVLWHQFKEAVVVEVYASLDERAVKGLQLVTDFLPLSRKMFRAHIVQRLAPTIQAGIFNIITILEERRILPSL